MYNLNEWNFQNEIQLVDQEYVQDGRNECYN